MTAPTPAIDPSVDVRTSVLVTEASKMYCDLLSMAFLAVPDRFQVVATAFTAADILAHMREHRPSVAIISDNLADGPLTGLRILPEVRKANPETRILLAMSSSDRELVIEAFRFGADGVFCRNSPFDMLCKSVDALAKGQIWANSKELRYVMEEFMRAPKATLFGLPSKAFRIVKLRASSASPSTL